MSDGPDVYRGRHILTGTWRSQHASGHYRFSCGPRDNYLELYVATANMLPLLGDELVQVADDLSIRGFADQQTGLAALEITVSGRDQPDPASRLDALVSRLQSTLPNLRVAEADSTPRCPKTPAPSEVRSVNFANEHAARSTDAVIDAWSEAAGEAVAQGRFKSAERLARAALAGGDSNAAEFLETLTAVRRAVKQVRRAPRSGVAYLTLAQAYFLADAGSAALDAAERAARLDSHLAEAHAVVAWELLFRGDLEGARARLELAEQAGAPGAWTQALVARLEPAPVQPPATRESRKHQATARAARTTHGITNRFASVFSRTFRHSPK